MTNLTDKTQNCGLVYCQGDCKVTSITHIEADKILNMIKEEIINKIQDAGSISDAIEIIEKMK